jgi:hypothetical protein
MHGSNPCAVAIPGGTNLQKKGQIRVCRLMSLTVRHLNESELLNAQNIRGWRHNNEVPPAKALRAFALAHWDLG